MTGYFLKKLTIEGFRGINNAKSPLKLTFKKESVTSIFAENGIGKSSVSQALEYALSGDIAFLSDMQSQEKSDEHILNFFHPDQKATINLEFSPDDGGTDVQIKIELDSNLERTITGSKNIPDVDEFLNNLHSDFLFLDSRKFIKFIEASSLERGRSFGPFLGLSKYGHFHRALKDSSSKANIRKDFNCLGLSSEVSDLESTISENSTKIQTLIEKSFSEIDNSSSSDLPQKILDALSKEALLQPHMEGMNSKTIDFDVLEKIVTDSETWDNRPQYDALQLKVKRLNEVAENFVQAKIDAEEIKESIRNHQDTSVQSHDHMRLAILQVADRHLNEEWDSHTCPLCLSPLQKPIRNHIEHDLGTLTDLIQSYKHLQSTVSVSRFLPLLEHNLYDLAPAEMKNCAAKIRNGVTQYNLEEKVIDEGISFINDYSAAINSEQIKTVTEITAVEKTRPDSSAELMSRIKDAKAILDLESASRQSTEKIQEIKSELKLFDRWIKFITEANDLFRNAESKLSNDKISTIKSDFKEMYSSIMHNADEIEPDLARSNGKENLDLVLANFYGETGRSVRGTLSESYRNNIAISLFLTAAFHSESSARFVILDDVTSSFDSGHQVKLMSYILQHLQFGANPKGLQFIVLSHDGQLKKTFNVLQYESKFHRSKWNSLALRPIIHKHEIGTQKLGLTQLRNKATNLANGADPTDAAPFIRQYYESALLTIIKEVNIPVLFEIGESTEKNTVHQLLSSIDAMVDLYSKAEILLTEFDQEKFSTHRLNCSSILLNEGSHYSTVASSSMSKDTYLTIIKDIDELIGCFQYDESANKKKFFHSLCCKERPKHRCTHLDPKEH